MKCSCQWIDAVGNPTPDDNEAIAMAVCHDPRSFGEKGSDPFPICLEHAKRKGEFWKIVPFQGQTDETMHPMALDDKRYFRVISDICIEAVKRSFPNNIMEILPTIRRSRDHWYFNKWGMYIGIEDDGHVHS